MVKQSIYERLREIGRMVNVANTPTYSQEIHFMLPELPTAFCDEGIHTGARYSSNPRDVTCEACRERMRVVSDKLYSVIRQFGVAAREVIDAMQQLSTAIKAHHPLWRPVRIHKAKHRQPVVLYYRTRAHLDQFERRGPKHRNRNPVFRPRKETP